VFALAIIPRGHPFSISGDPQWSVCRSCFLIVVARWRSQACVGLHAGCSVWALVQSHASANLLAPVFWRPVRSLVLPSPFQQMKRFVPHSVTLGFVNSIGSIFLPIASARFAAGWTPFHRWWGGAVSCDLWLLGSLAGTSPSPRHQTVPHLSGDCGDRRDPPRLAVAGARWRSPTPSNLASLCYSTITAFFGTASPSSAHTRFGDLVCWACASRFSPANVGRPCV